MTGQDALALHQQYVVILKKRFPNLTTEETTELARVLVVAVITILGDEK